MTRGSLAVGVVIVVVLLTVARLTHPRDRGSSRPVTSAARLSEPVVFGGAPVRPRPNPHRRRTTADETHGAVRPAPEAARRTASDFLRSYLAYEVGRATFADLRTLRGTSTAELWAWLNSGRGEPHAPTTMPAARLARLVPGVSARRQAVALLATLKRGHRAAPLALVLRRHRGQWRVAGVGR